jgi:hypothetical protein
MNLGINVHAPMALYIHQSIKNTLHSVNKKKFIVKKSTNIHSWEKNTNSVIRKKGVLLKYTWKEFMDILTSSFVYPET